MGAKTKEILTSSREQSEEKEGLVPIVFDEHEKEQTEGKPLYSAPVKLGVAASADLPPFNDGSRKPKINFFQRSYGNRSTLRYFHDAIQKKKQSGRQGGIYSVDVPAVLNTPGQPLDQEARSFFEPRFGRDFSSVRIHADAKAAESARAMNALAYTVGSDIVLGPGVRTSGKGADLKLLAHELTHTVQQGQFQNKAVQRQNGGAGGAPNTSDEGQEGSGGGTSVPESGPEPEEDKTSPDDAPAESPPPRSLSESLDPKLLLRDELIEEIKLINAWVASHTPDEPTSGQLTEAKTALEAEFKRTGGRCPVTAGPRTWSQPSHVSDELIDRMMGKYIPEDQGEGCKEYPYVASPYEGVCTIGYGHQIHNPPCPILDNTGDEEDPDYPAGKPPSERRKKIAMDYWKSTGKPFPDFTCGCSKHLDCKGEEAKAQLKADVAGKENFVHKNVPFDLDQDQFDSMVDWVLSGAWNPNSELLQAMKLYWCSDTGKNYVRSIFLKSGITVKGSSEPVPGLVARRKNRVWPEYPQERLLDENPSGPPVQPKLRIGRSDDIYEQEADSIAERVLQISDPTIQRKPT